MSTYRQRKLKTHSGKAIFKIMNWSNEQITKVVKGILPPTEGLSPLRLAVLSRASVSNLKIPKITTEHVQKALKGDQDIGTSQAHFQRKGWSREVSTLHAGIDYTPTWERVCSIDKQRENSSPAVLTNPQSC